MSKQGLIGILFALSGFIPLFPIFIITVKHSEKKINLNKAKDTAKSCSVYHSIHAPQLHRSKGVSYILDLIILMYA